MSRKRKRSRQSGSDGRTGPASISPGSAVRVRQGTVDPDFPEVPLGGWAGTVREVDLDSGPTLVLVEWDAATLGRMDARYRELCEKEGLEIETMWLEATDVEPTGGLVPQPEGLGVQPEDSADEPDEPEEQGIDEQERRILTALGYAGDPGPLPPVNEENLRQYHRYLRTRLTFPCSVRYYEDPVNFPDKALPLSLKGLAPEDQCVGEFGLLVEADLGDRPGTLVLPLIKMDMIGEEESKELVQDYTRWFVMGRALGDLEEGLNPLPDARRLIWRSLRNVGLAGAVCGALTGAALATLEGGQLAVLVAAIVCAVLGYLLGTRYGQITGAIHGYPRGGVVGGLFGLLAGGLLGVFVGAVTVAWLGTLPGSIAGTLLGRGLAALGWKPLSRFGWTFFGVLVGGLVLTFVTDYEQQYQRVLRGVALGGLSGAVLAVLLLVALLGAILAVSKRP